MPKMTVILDPELHRAVRHRCVDLGLSFQKLTVQALKEYLDRGEARKPKKGRR